MEDSKPLKLSLSQWRKLVAQCLSQRASAAEFRDLSKVMLDRYYLSSKRLIDIVLESRIVTDVVWDPLIPLYVEVLHRLSRAKLHDVLISLLQHSTISGGHGSGNGSGTGSGDHDDKFRRQHGGNAGAVSGFEDVKSPSTLMTDYRILQRIIMAATSGHAPKTTTDAVKTFAAVSDWILAMLAWNSKGENDGDQSGLLTTSPEAQSIFDSLGILLAALVTTEKTVSALSIQGKGGKFFSYSFSFLCLMAHYSSSFSL